jgi:Mn2+/Fe2+ NRAMP family transporter
VKRFFAVTLGILTAIGGFVDIGDLVANALVGSRYGFALAWVVPVGVVGICLYAEMCGRVAAASGRAVFDLIRERLGPRWGLANLTASFLVTALTLTAEIGGVALALELATSVNYLLWVPMVGFLVWLVIWRVKFDRMEQVFGLGGLALIVFAVAFWKLGPDWGQLIHDVTHPTLPPGEGLPTALYYAIALFGAAMTPYEVFFFSSGGVEERWGAKDIGVMRSNVFIGFPLGGLLSLAIMGAAALVFFPVGVQVETLGQVALPIAPALGKLGLAVALLGVFAATFGAALETGLSAGYTVAQYFGWQWGKFVRPLQAARFHLVILLTLIAGVMVMLTTVDPIKVTEYSIVFSAIALPLTYLPILVIANDPDYMGDQVNGRITNVLGTAYLLLILAVSAAAIPLMIATKAGQ